MQTIIEPIEANADSLKSTLSRIGSGESEETLSIDLQITGGCPGERLDIRISLLSSCQVKMTHTDELLALNKQLSRQLPKAEISALASLVDIESIIGLQRNLDERYLPDSLIGMLTISIGSSSVRFLFPILDEKPRGNGMSTMTIEFNSDRLFVSASEVSVTVQPLFHQLAKIVNTYCKLEVPLGSDE